MSFTETRPRQSTVDTAASEFLGHEAFMGKTVTYHVAGVPAPGTPGPEAQARQELDGDVHEVCPICHYRLPSGWRMGNVTCIAMAGARATGKSVYIAVMVKQLARALERRGLELADASAETADHYRTHYETPFYEKRGLLESTTSSEVGESYQHDPLIFSMGIWNGTKQFIAIRDVAGEDLSLGKLAGVPGTFFAAADGVFFLFDPFQVREIRDALRDDVEFDERLGGDPRNALATVLRLIGDSAIPLVAVLVSKFDALHAVGRVAQSRWAPIMSNAGAAFCRDPGLLHEQYNDNDGLLLHYEVQSLLQKLEAPPSLRNMTNPDTGRGYDHRFFAVSALGDSPLNPHFNPMGFAPFRCLDPLRWVLSRRGLQ
ncbi:hypothetical protein [Mycolicibacterium sp. 018/SC-01/001]|uniref:hypothetical protein n=1 Tax=Mycolicibacterium sp. 018/SC-01/001 TaxID=2592069 RepID=UPI002104A37D|nr:hypothetical protein [Mycolicibacterium sp. 018/SC-01/001]